MLAYPQLSSGALIQFPSVVRRQLRTIVNQAEDGSTIKLTDAGLDVIEWRLEYCGLSDDELDRLLAFYAECEGSLQEFTFIDPTANLLASSGALDDDAWSSDPFVALAPGIADPQGAANAWRVTNSGAAIQALSQTVNAPAEYVYCFSVYARSMTPLALGLCIGGARSNVPVGTTWQRFAYTTDAAGPTPITFRVEVPPGSDVDLYGPQAEPQPNPSAYRTSTRSGCYEGSRFSDESFSFQTTGPNSHNTTVKITNANHL